MKPSEVLLTELSKEKPFACMLGCAEQEAAARKILTWLASNGDMWNVHVPLQAICTEWEISHGHPEFGPHEIIPAYFVNGLATDLFINRVHRREQ